MEYSVVLQEKKKKPFFKGLLCNKLKKIINKQAENILPSHHFIQDLSYIHE